MKVRNILLIILTSLLTGLGVAALRIISIHKSRAFVTYGSWKGTTDLQLNKDNLVTTQVTLFALFVLPSHEAVYLFASEDDKKEGLNGNSDYTIEGNIHDLKANYWSITAYGQDLYLMKTEEDRYSFNNHNLGTDSAGNFKIILSAQKAAGNWLPLKKSEKFRLVLRLYRGDKDFIDHLDQAHLPVIKKSGE